MSQFRLSYFCAYMIYWISQTLRAPLVNHTGLANATGFSLLRTYSIIHALNHINQFFGEYDLP